MTKYLRPLAGEEGLSIVLEQMRRRFMRGDGLLSLYPSWHLFILHTVAFPTSSQVAMFLQSDTYQREVRQRLELMVDLSVTAKCLCYVQMNCLG